jgi:hypothetical protein
LIDQSKTDTEERPCGTVVRAEGEGKLMSTDTYVFVEIRLAVQHLATSAATIQDRMRAVYSGGMFKLRPEDLPSDLGSQFLEIKKCLTEPKTKAAPGTIASEGGIKIACSQLTDDEATEVAKAIIKLHDSLEQRLRKDRPF